MRHEHAESCTTHNMVRLVGMLLRASGGALTYADFIERALLCHQSGNVFFVHAAADPMLPPESQTPETLLWGHPEFPARRRGDGRWVVHGHVVVNEPMARDGIIAIDTGAYFSHRLTAARIEPGKVSFL